MHSEGDPNCQCMECYGHHFIEELDELVDIQELER